MPNRPRDARHSRRWRESTVPRIIRRDGGICHICLQPGAETADHLVPKALGGSDAPDNLAAAHIHCNRSRGTRSIEAVRTSLGINITKGWDW